MKGKDARISTTNAKTSLYDHCYYHCDSRCCNSIFLLPGEREILLKYDLIKPTDDSIIDKGAYFILEANKKTGKCRFLENNLCTIQEVKPIDCKAWPLYFNSKGENTGKVSCDINCPVIKRLPQKFIKAALKELDKVPLILRKEFFSKTAQMGYELCEALLEGNCDSLSIYELFGKPVKTLSSINLGVL